MSAGSWLGLALLGGVGATTRFAVDSRIERRLGSAFPYGTLTINVSGSFLLGLLSAAAVGGTTLFLIGTGLLGSYTTYSTWMFESQRLAADGENGLATVNALGSALAGLVAAIVGWKVGGLV